MALILHIESSTSVCSVCLSKNREKIAGKEIHEINAHSKMLTVLIEQMLKEAKLNLKEIDAVAVSKGPGSYTGLRIGVSVAKGIAYGAGVPLISVGTLQNMAFGAKQHLASEENFLLAPMIDARRMEVYTQLFDKNLKAINNISAEIITNTFLEEELEHKKVYFFGDGAAKCKEVISKNNAHFLEDLYPSADYMINFSHQAFENKQFEDVAYFEPFYLKDFIANVPTKHIYG